MKIFIGRFSSQPPFGSVFWTSLDNLTAWFLDFATRRRVVFRERWQQPRLSVRTRTAPRVMEWSSLRRRSIQSRNHRFAQPAPIVGIRSTNHPCGSNISFAESLLQIPNVYADLDPFEAPALLGAHLQFAALIKFLGGLLASIGFLGPKLAPNIGIADWHWSLLGQAYGSEYRQVREISHSPIIGGNVPFAPLLRSHYLFNLYRYPAAT